MNRAMGTKEHGGPPGGWAPWAVFVSTLVLRVATAPRFPTEWDSVQFVLGVDRFDVTQDSPNAPGYWSYVMAARILRLLSPLSAHASLVAVVAVASAATGALLFLSARHLGGRWLGWVAGAAWATNPLAWFYGSIVNAKVFDSVALAGVLLLAITARRGGPQVTWAAAAIGLGLGFRPSSAAILLPLGVYIVVRCCHRPADLVKPLLVGAAAMAMWLVPVALEQPGGLRTLKSVNDFMFEITAERTSVLYGAPAAAVRDNVGRALSTAAVFVLPVLPLTLLGAAAAVRAPEGQRRPPLLGVLALATVPGLALTALLSLGTAGHALAHLPAAILLLLAPAAALRHAPRLRRVATAVAVLVSLGAAQRFVMGNGSVPASLASHRWIPSGQSLEEIRRVDRTSRRDAALGPYLDPDRDVLVFVLGNGEARFRPASLFLSAHAVHLLSESGDAISTYRGYQWLDEDARLEVPPGGRAVVVLDRDDPALFGPQPGERLDLPEGVIARAVPVGGMVGGTVVVADPSALRPKRDAAHVRPCGGSPC